MTRGTKHAGTRRGALVRLLGLGLLLAAGVCGRSNADSPFQYMKTGTFYAAAVPLNGGTVRGYVTLRLGVPTAVGMEMTDGVLTNLPDLPLGAASATFGGMPAVSNALPFVAIAVGFFPAGHPPTGIGDKPHFHPIFMLMPPQQPDPPNFALETAPVAPLEVPAGNVNLGDLAPGIGVAYQDPSTPQNQPGWDTVGQNYFFYNGHMSGISLGATDDYMQRLAAHQDIARGDVIPQPQVYPRFGFYPNRYMVSYDDTRKVYLFELRDFQLRGAAPGP